MSNDFKGEQRELLARVLQHGGVLTAPFGHLGHDSLLAEMLADIDDLEAQGLIRVSRAPDDRRPQRLELTQAGYAALGVS